ncbi:hypothetical protein [Parasphingorhabdus litoris]|uniref:hypothetical protein n=1 Tax=Parasphingorhabdus litoris TaxID=394733 RepID=UPI001E48A518|nr:hypothetical protein [Parasphingorhabdus litoris]
MNFRAGLSFWGQGERGSDNQGCGVLRSGDNAGAYKQSGRDKGGDGGGDLGSEITGHGEILWVWCRSAD